MNPASGVYDFSNLDAYLALAYSHSVFDVVLVLGATPNWISSDPSNTVCDYASISPGSCAPPLDLNSDGTGTDQTWRSFVYAVASHVTTLNPAVYSKVTTYEMWNEFSRSTESWTGSQAQMLRMSEDAHCIVKGSGAVTATGEACVAQAFLIPAVGVAPNSMMASPSAQASAPDVNVLGVYFSSPGPPVQSTSLRATITRMARVAALLRRRWFRNGGCCRQYCRSQRGDLRRGARREAGATLRRKSRIRTCNRLTLPALIFWGGRPAFGGCTGTRGAIRGAACGARVE